MQKLASLLEFEMNEQMLELYRRAQVPYTAIDPSNNMPYETTTFSAEKFAELIVRECLNQLQELTPLKISNEEHQKLVDATHIAAVSIGVAKIKHHFGVE